jgi:hypothetical protein
METMFKFVFSSIFPLFTYFFLFLNKYTAGFVLGPQKLGQMARDLGAVAGELKDVPKEFQEVNMY